MTTVEELEKEVLLIKERNRRVGADKAWETSFTRRALLFLFTYLALGLYMNAIRLPQPWLNAFIPSFGFLLSTLTLPFFKRLWQKYLFRSKGVRKGG